MSKIKQNILNFLLFPEYRLYKIALKAKNEHEQDGLEIFAAAWVVLKIAIVLGVILNLLTPYKIYWDTLAVSVTTEIIMLAILTLIMYIKIHESTRY